MLPGRAAATCPHMPAPGPLSRNPPELVPRWVALQQAPPPAAALPDLPATAAAKAPLRIAALARRPLPRATGWGRRV